MFLLERFTQSTALDQMIHTSRSSDNDLDSVLQVALIITNTSATNASIDIDIQIVSKSSQDDLNLEELVPV